MTQDLLPGPPPRRIVAAQPEPPVETREVEVPDPAPKEDMSVGPLTQIKRKPKRQAPTDRPVPTMGWRAWLYWCFTTLGFPNIAPKVGRKELRLLKREAATKRLRESAGQVGSMVFSFFNAKGASATTTTTVYTTAALSELSRRLTVAVDGNPASGTVGLRFGINHGDTVTTQNVVDGIDKGENLAHRDFRSVITQAAASVNGVRVVSAAPIVEESRRVSGTGMASLLNLLGLNCEFLSVDTGNDVGYTVAKAIASKSEVLVFTANVRVADSLRQLSTTMETLRVNDFEEKVRNSVVVISNLSKGADLDEYRKFLSEVNTDNVVTRPLDHKFDGQFLGVPHDPYIEKDGIVRLESLRWETYQAYIHVAVAMMEQAQKMREKARANPWRRETND